MTIITYKEYAAKLEIEVSKLRIKGTTIDTQDVLYFYGQDLEEVRTEFIRVVEEYLKECRQKKRDPRARRFSGNLPYRTTPENHRNLYLAAQRKGISINALMDEVLIKAANKIINGAS